MNKDHSSKIQCYKKAQAGEWATFSCGIASLKSLLSFWGIETPDLDKWMDEAVTQGVVKSTTGFQWKKAQKWGERMGIQMEYFHEMNRNKLIPFLLEQPLLISIQIENLGGHVVVLVGLNDETESRTWTYYDPETGGFEKISDSIFTKIFRGHVMRVLK